MPDEELKKLLEKNLEASEYTLKLVKRMYRSQQIARLLTALYWFIIIGGAIGLYYYLRPTINSVMDTWRQVSDTVSGVSDNYLPKDIPSDVIQKIQGLLPR